MTTKQPGGGTGPAAEWAAGAMAAVTPRAGRLSDYVTSWRARPNRAEENAAFLRTAPRAARELADLIGEECACEALQLMLLIGSFTTFDAKDTKNRPAKVVKSDLARIASLAGELASLLQPDDTLWLLDIEEATRRGLEAGPLYYTRRAETLRPRLEHLAALASGASSAVSTPRGAKPNTENLLFFESAVDLLRAAGVRMAYAENSIMTRAVGLVHECFGRDPEPVRDRLKRAVKKGVQLKGKATK